MLKTHKLAAMAIVATLVAHAEGGIVQARYRKQWPDTMEEIGISP